MGGPSKTMSTVKDLRYDFDAVYWWNRCHRMVKQIENKYYLSDFKIYENEVTNGEVSIYQVLYASTGIVARGEANNSDNNVYIGGKK